MRAPRKANGNKKQTMQRMSMAHVPKIGIRFEKNGRTLITKRLFSEIGPAHAATTQEAGQP